MKKSCTSLGNFGITTLKIIGLTGLIALTLLVPQMTRAFEPFVQRRDRKFFPSDAKRAISRLRQRGLIYVQTINGRTFYALTQKGQKIFAKYSLKELTIPTQRRWDNKWRILIFDVVERKKAARNGIRETLRALKFERLQDSVWIFPFPCEDIIELIRTAHGIRRSVIYLTTNRFENDHFLIQIFQLPS